MNTKIKFVAPQVLLEIMSECIHPANSVLEIGPGVRIFELTFTPLLRVFIEPSLEYVKNLDSQTSAAKGKLIIKCDAITILNSLQENSFEIVICSDVLEHLTKEDGQILIREMLRVASKQVIVFTPLGFMPQHMDSPGIDPWGFSEVELQTHLSGWEPEEFPDEFSVLVAKDFHFQPTGQSFGAICAIANFSSNVKKLHDYSVVPFILSPSITTLAKDNFFSLY
jgi:hypothetical protein